MEYCSPRNKIKYSEETELSGMFLSVFTKKTRAIWSIIARGTKCTIFWCFCMVTEFSPDQNKKIKMRKNATGAPQHLGYRVDLFGTISLSVSCKIVYKPQCSL